MLDVVVSHFEARIVTGASTSMSRPLGTSFEADVGSFVAGDSPAGLSAYALATFEVRLRGGPCRSRDYDAVKASAVDASAVDASAVDASAVDASAVDAFDDAFDAVDAFDACGGVVHVDVLQGGTVVVRCTACETFARDVIGALARFMSAGVVWDSFCVHGISRLWPAESDHSVLWTAARARAVGPPEFQRVRLCDSYQHAMHALRSKQPWQSRHSRQSPQSGRGCCWLHEDGTVTLDGFADVDAMIHAAQSELIPLSRALLAPHAVSASSPPVM